MTPDFVLAVCAAALGGMMALMTAFKAHRAVPRWCFALGMAGLSLEALFRGLAAEATVPERTIHWESLALAAMSVLPATWLLFSFSYGRGSYRTLVRNYRFWLLAALVVPVGLTLVFSRHLIVAIPSARQDGTWLLRFEPASLVLHLVFFLSIVFVLMNLEATFRASVGTMRWRIKFMLLGLAVVFVVRAYSSTQILLFRSLNLSLQTFDSGAFLVGCLLILRGLFRAGQFDVKLYPSQTVLYGSFTVLLAGLYLIIVGVLAKVVAFLGGDAAFELKAFLVLIALVLLSVFLLSDRVRLHTKRFVSRHFQRPTHDYRTVWRIFTKASARRVEQADFCSAVVRMVSDVFESLSVAIWLVDESKTRLSCAASTALSQAEAGERNLDPADVALVVAGLSSHSAPIDLDSSSEPWTAALRRTHPDAFRKGGHRFCVSISAAGEFLGVLALGDRVGGVSFSVQDLDLLQTVSDQVAASLLNIQLSQKVSQAKQLEAFQAMSAFFVHDLKNTASTLSLMLQNLPAHYDDPKFREDAFRGISKTVAHVNDLIARLTVLRQESEIRLHDCDLNELLADILKSQAQSDGIQLVKELNPIPRLRLDPSQIQKVVTNLILNARESISESGTISVATSQRNGWVVISITDTGCGMSPEFLNRSLFRPFQTTKKKGMGIGMFHCKIIVEAHHGRIEAESQLGKGTSFRVLLPVGTKIPE